MKCLCPGRVFAYVSVCPVSCLSVCLSLGVAINLASIGHFLLNGIESLVPDCRPDWASSRGG